MTPRALERLDLLAAQKEAALVEALSRHSRAVQHFQAQREMLASYYARLDAGWRRAGGVTAGDAARAARFGAQALAAMLQLDASLAAEQARLMESASALARLRAHRRALRERLAAKRRAAAARAEAKAAADLPARGRVISLSDH
ncbi:hypothetical protein [Acidocella sp.]|uniref:hypothetical protein n=1 Tax=Acidocella sp. TaxID=50710 RepID=UPI0026252769|nr:hypothetical protein [Acidocella sp.]